MSLKLVFKLSVTLSITPVDWFSVESDFDKTLPTLFSSSNIEQLMKYTNLKLRQNTYNKVLHIDLYHCLCLTKANIKCIKSPRMVYFWEVAICLEC